MPLLPLYPIFINWMPLHIPTLFLMYAFIVMKLLNYFNVIPISFQWQNKNKNYLNLLELLIIYQFVVTCAILLYKKNVEIKIEVLKSTGAVNVEEYQRHKKVNTMVQLKKLENDGKFQRWKKEKLEKQESQKMMPKVVYEVIESSSSEEQIERMSEHRLATSKKIF